jgi:photosystem II stability/assembly factor-like uncharacterized protein
MMKYYPIIQSMKFLLNTKNYFMKKFVVLSIALLAFGHIYGQQFWEEITLPEPGLAVFAIGMDDAGLLVLGATESIYYSSDEGNSWTESTNWPDYDPNCIAFNSAQTIFVGTFSNGIYRSTDGGQTFTEINNGLTFMNVWDLLVMENDDILLVTPGGIFRSTNNGDQWALYGSGLPNDEVQRITLSENGDLFAGTSESGVYKSTDGGATWTACNTGLPSGANITAIKGAPNGEVYAGLFPEGMYRTSNNGSSWEPFNNGLPFLKSDFGRGNSITAITATQLVMICLIFMVGIFLHVLDFDFDAGWTTQSGGLPGEPTVNEIAVGPQEQLFLGTYDQGLYRNAWPVGIPSVIHAPQNNLLHVYPNPFAYKTTIDINLPEAGNVTLKITNVKGKTLDIITNNYYPSGKQTFTWQTEGLAPGVYILQLIGNNLFLNRKVVVVD